jgi:hypothetical protein
MLLSIYTEKMTNADQYTEILHILSVDDMTALNGKVDIS